MGSKNNYFHILFAFRFTFIFSLSRFLDLDLHSDLHSFSHSPDFWIRICIQVYIHFLIFQIFGFGFAFRFTFCRFLDLDLHSDLHVADFWIWICIQIYILQMFGFGFAFRFTFILSFYGVLDLDLHFPHDPEHSLTFFITVSNVVFGSPVQSLTRFDWAFPFDASSEEKRPKRSATKQWGITLHVLNHTYYVWYICDVCVCARRKPD